MKLPNGNRAFVDVAKLRGYCLNSAHPKGKDKARVFKSALEIGPDDAEWLRRALLDAAETLPCAARDLTEHGQTYEMDLPLQHAGKIGVIRSAWIIRTNEKFPRFVTCYVLLGKHAKRAG